ncbi:MAG: hypothetical protein ACRELY_32155 [Polyangiaceae bacterium]
MQSARAQGTDAPLPQLPPNGDAQNPPTAPAQTPPPGAQPTQQPGVVVAPDAEPPPTVVQVGPPPAGYQRTTEGENGEMEEPKHAPKFSLYTGLNIGVIGYGGSFFYNQAAARETTGNFVGSGLSFEIDVGARLGKRYVPYAMWEHAFLAPGHRFENTDTKASSDFIGLGFRLIAGDVDNVGFLSDLGIGFRTVTLANDSQTFKMTALEIARLGLGAEIRFSKLFTLSPLARISVGQMSDSQSGINYGGGQGDAQTGTSFQANQQIGDNPVNYVTVGLGCGGYFDFFGK